MAEELDTLQAEIKRLKEKVARYERWMNETGVAIVRDSAELVRVLAELEKSEATLKAQLHQALRFQRALQPRPIADPRLAIQGISLPAEVISGDLYDFARYDPDVIRVFVADATGHGVAAGLATMFIKSEYEAHKREARSPAGVLRAMNDQLTSRYGSLELRFTALCIDVHLAEHRIRYSAAAHPGPLLCRGEAIEELPTGGTFIGIAPGAEFSERDVPFRPGDELVAFSDGLTDASAADGSLFGDERVRETVARARAEKRSPAAVLVESLSQFVGEGRPLTDDVTIVATAFSDGR